MEELGDIEPLGTSSETNRMKKDVRSLLASQALNRFP